MSLHKGVRSASNAPKLNITSILSEVRGSPSNTTTQSEKHDTGIRIRDEFIYDALTVLLRDLAIKTDVSNVFLLEPGFHQIEGKSPSGE